MGQGWWGYVKEVGEEGSGTVRGAHPGESGGEGTAEGAPAEEDEHSSQRGRESGGKGHSLACVSAGIDAGRGRAGQRAGAAALHRRGGEKEFPPFPELRSSPSRSRCWGNLRCRRLPGDSSGAAGVRGLLNGGSAALLVAAVLGEGAGEGRRRREGCESGSGM